MSGQLCWIASCSLIQVRGPGMQRRRDACVQKKDTTCHHMPAGGPVDQAALVFHPWAWLGGCMFDPTVSALTHSAAKSGLFGQVLRYNVRGTGRSTGFKSLGVASDSADAAELCRWLRSRQWGDKSDIQRPAGKLPSTRNSFCLWPLCMKYA